jgi:ribosomal protein L37E
MELIIAVVLVITVTLLYTLFIRAKDIPPADPVSPTAHLDERKAAIYENLRDLQFEYRVGKLSDADYQQTKVSLQKELAGVMAEIDRVMQGAPVVEKPKPKAQPSYVCRHCGKQFKTAMKFCGECGKAMS